MEAGKNDIVKSVAERLAPVSCLHRHIQDRAERARLVCRARARVKRVYTILGQINIGPDRVRMYNLSAGEGAKFAAFANEFVSKIEELGPSPINVSRKAEHQKSSQEVER